MTVDTRPPTETTSGDRAGAPGARRTRQRRNSANEDATTGLVSTADWRSPRVRRTLGTAHILLLLLLLFTGLVPMLWLFKAAVSPAQETLQYPLRLWPHRVAWGNLRTAWTDLRLSLYFWNTVVIAMGSWAAQLLIATTAGFGLSVLKPKYAKVLNGLVIATLFIPAVVLLVPLYLTVLKVPLLHWKLIDSYWALWLPAGANAFNVLIVKRFFDNLPREIFEAARVDGAGPFRLFRSIVLPMSRPILGVVSIFAFISSWRDFLWPLLVISSPDKQPLSVRLPNLQSSTEIDVFLAALFISTALPIAIFLIFQRVVLRGTGLAGSIKG